VTGVLSGILTWIVNTIIQIETNGQFNTLGDALQAAFNCNQLLPNVANFGICQAFVSGLAQKINDALNMLLVNYSLMTLKGTALVTDAHHLDKGHWDGTLGDGIGLFKNFDGDWSATR
jgi:hypothetical protein